jgi:GTP-binding protein LepA
VISSVRVFNGVLRSGARAAVRATPGQDHDDAEEIGVRLPDPTPVAALGPGEVGYLIAGIKDVGEAASARPSPTRRRAPSRSRATATRSRWCSAACIPSTATSTPTCASAREAALNDSSFTYEPETSGALGFGFRCGFLGLLHMEIVRERLEREYDLARRDRAERRVPRAL